MSVYSELINDSGFDPGTAGPSARFMAWGYEHVPESQPSHQWLIDMLQEELNRMDKGKLTATVAFNLDPANPALTREVDDEDSEAE